MTRYTTQYTFEELKAMEKTIERVHYSMDTLLDDNVRKQLRNVVGIMRILRHLAGSNTSAEINLEQLLDVTTQGE